MTMTSKMSTTNRTHSFTLLLLFWLIQWIHVYPFSPPNHIIIRRAKIIPTLCHDSKRTHFDDSSTLLYAWNKWNYVEGDVSPYSSQLSSEYKRCKSMHLFLAVLVLLAPLLTPPLPVDVSLLSWSGIDRAHKTSVLVMAAVVSHILAGAADLLRLNSDTYKRLNLGLFFYSALQLMATYWEHSSPFYMALSLLVRFLTMGSCFFGWIQGVLTTSASSSAFADRNVSLVWKISHQLYQGTRQTLSSLFISTKKSGGPYPLLLIGCSFSMMQNLFHLILHVFAYPKCSPCLVGNYLSQLAHGGFLFSMILALKDASERQRLSGTTFIQLNLILGLYAWVDGIVKSITISNVNAVSPIISFLLGSIFVKKAYDGNHAKKTQDH